MLRIREALRAAVPHAWLDQSALGAACRDEAGAVVPFATHAAVAGGVAQEHGARGLMPS